MWIISIFPDSICILYLNNHRCLFEVFCQKCRDNWMLPTRADFQPTCYYLTNVFWLCSVSLPSLTKFESQHSWWCWPRGVRTSYVLTESLKLVLLYFSARCLGGFSPRAPYAPPMDLFVRNLEEAGCNLEGMIWLGSPATQAGSYYHYYPFQSELIMAGVLNLSGVVCYHQGWCGACIEFDNVIRDVQSALKPFAESADIEFVWISCDARLWPHRFLQCGAPKRYK